MPQASVYIHLPCGSRMALELANKLFWKCFYDISKLWPFFPPGFWLVWKSASSYLEMPTGGRHFRKSEDVEMYATAPIHLRSVDDFGGRWCFVFTLPGSPLCSCCVPDHMGLSFLPTYGCQSNRTASVAALRMKAREHSEAVLQSANLLASSSPSPGSGAKPGPENALDNKPSLAVEQNESEKSV